MCALAWCARCLRTEQSFRLAQGGAIHNARGTVMVEHSLFEHNKVKSNGGGAIYSEKGGTVTVEHSLFQHNEAVSVAQWPNHVVDVSRHTII